MTQPTWITTFKQAIEHNQVPYSSDYRRVADKVNASTAIYQGKPMRFVYQPMLFDERQTQIFQELSQTLVGILKKVIFAYRNDAHVRERFGFSNEMEALILADPGYLCEFPMARFDIFYDFETGEFKFCELNADGTSSMNEARELATILLESQALDPFKDQYIFEQDELFDSWVDTLIALYKEAKSDKAKQRPTIVIADFEGDGITSEFEIFKKRLIERGYPTQICDPSHLVYKDNQLWLGNHVVDIIYRRATTGRMVEEIDRVQDLVVAYKHQDVCMVGGFVSQLIHNKVLFALLHEEGLFDFSQAEVDYIHRHIPYTTFLATASDEQLAEVKANKDNYLLKPFDQYAAHGIRVGKNVSNEEWQTIVEQCKGKDYLIQAFYDVPKLDLCTENVGKLTFKPHRHMIGLFMYAQQFVGTYIRVGQKPIIATHGGESLTVAGFLVKKK
jgi:glutathionylspermidine synthase